MDVTLMEPASPSIYKTTHRTGVLDVQEIWEVVRSGVWYPNGWDDMQTTSQLVDDDVAYRVRSTMALIAEKLQGVGVGPLVAETPPFVELVELNKKAIQDYSIPELQCVLATLQSLSSPWRKLPPELLIEIFSWCIQPNTVLSTSRAPLLLTQICSRWYYLTTDTPSLWTSLALTENFLMHEQARLCVARDFEKQWRGHRGLGSNATTFMSMFLHRSRILPFSLCAHSGIFLAPDMKQLFYEHASRLKNLALLFPEFDGWPFPPKPPTLDPFVAPLLETLDIYALEVRSSPFGSRDSGWNLPFMDLIRACAPTLKRLNFIMRGAPAWPKFDPSHSWNKLTHITWRPTIVDTEVLKLFYSAPNLVYASFPGIIPYGRRFDPSAGALEQQDPVVLRNLETLVVGMTDMTTIFDAITSPGLRHLVHLAPSDGDKRAMIGFFRRSVCQLETLYMYHTSYKQYEDLLEVWESVESSSNQGSCEQQLEKGKGHLKALLVTDAHPDRMLLSDKIMEKLTWVPQQKKWDDDTSATANIDSSVVRGVDDYNRGDVLFPGLEYLSLYDIGSTVPGKLPAMLRSRTAAPSPPDEEPQPTSTPVAKLKMFETWDQQTGLNYVSHEDWKELEYLRDAGLVFRLFQSSDSGSGMTDAEKVLLQRYVEEGLVVRDYLHDIGQFAPIPWEEEVGMPYGVC